MYSRVEIIDAWIKYDVVKEKHTRNIHDFTLLTAASSPALRYFQCQITEGLTREPACVVANPALYRLLRSLIGGNVDSTLIFMEHSQVIGQSHTCKWMSVILPLILAMKESVGRLPH